MLKEREVSNRNPHWVIPSPQVLARLDLKDLGKCCLGYRGAIILELAKDVMNGKINLLDMENLSDAEKLCNKLKDIKGIGDFVAHNVLMCMGFYHKVPVDSETIRHIKQVHALIIFLNLFTATAHFNLIHLAWSSLIIHWCDINRNKKWELDFIIALIDAKPVKRYCLMFYELIIWNIMTVQNVYGHRWQHIYTDMR